MALKKESADQKLSKEHECLKRLLKRRIISYPNHREHMIIVAFCYSEELKKAEFVRGLIRGFINTLNEKKQSELLALFKEMTPEMIKRPYTMSKFRI